MRALALMIAMAACKHRDGARVVEHERHLPTITVTAELPGASATTTASAVATPLERQFGQLAKLERIESRSTPGAMEITLEFAPGQDLDAAARSVQEGINAAANLLPRTLPTLPAYMKVGHEGAVMRIALYGELPGLEVTNAASTMAQKLAQVPGVGRVRLCGGFDETWHVRIDPTALAARGKTIDDVVTELRGGNVDLDRRDQTLPDLGDIAAVEHGGVAESCRALDAAHAIVVITIQPQPGADLEQVRGSLESLMPSLDAMLPQAIKVEVMPRARPLAFALHFEPDVTEARRLDVLRDILGTLPAEATHAFVELGARDPDTAELRVVPLTDAVESTVIQRIAMVSGVALRDRRDHVIGLCGADPDALRAEVDKLAKTLATDKDLHVIQTLGTRTATVRNVTLDRDRMAALGVRPDAADQALTVIGGGMRVSTLFTQLGAIPVMLSLRDDPADALSQVYVRSGTGSSVPLSAFASFTQVVQPIEVLHEGQFSWLGIRVSGSLDELQAALAKSPSPTDIRREIREPE